VQNYGGGVSTNMIMLLSAKWRCAELWWWCQHQYDCYVIIGKAAKVTDMVMVMVAVVRHDQHQQHENGESDRYDDVDGGSGAT